MWKNVSVTNSGRSCSFLHSIKSWKGIWGAKVPERIKHGAIATRLNLAIKHVASDSLCPICRQEEEFIEHLFLLCPWTTPLWHGLQVCRVPTSQNVSNMARWLENIIENENLTNYQNTLP